MIESLVFQKPTRLLQQYEFTITWVKDETLLFPAIVTVSHEEGKTTIVDIIIEGDLPENFDEFWNPEWAIKQIYFELGEELNKINKSETF